MRLPGRYDRLVSKEAARSSSPGSSIRVYQLPNSLPPSFHPQKKLIVLSRQWPQHKAGVFDRLREMADKEEDVDKKMGLRRIFRSLQGVSWLMCRGRCWNKYGSVVGWGQLFAAPDGASSGACRG